MKRLTNKQLYPYIESRGTNYYVSPPKNKEARLEIRELVEQSPSYEELYRKLGIYEDAEEQGRLVVLNKSFNAQDFIENEFDETIEIVRTLDLSLATKERLFKLIEKDLSLVLRRITDESALREMEKENG